uniref:AlNc14C225G9202 protein n=1 Tax=Albugo laibachii Nc14 TaxID=890382 RepID=F0WS64_9STRA|nr:AlNc14C225G9202 [Albugo laibachii Nc14]CCA26549.1 AlNc14C385G11254 [Albugo laibachii Nc14]|eukprot:CCA26549.1 AlNc14C385G11254 [Albugo laibachii Nc14]
MSVKICHDQRPDIFLKVSQYLCCRFSIQFAYSVLPSTRFSTHWKAFLRKHFILQVKPCRSSDSPVDTGLQKGLLRMQEALLQALGPIGMQFWRVERDEYMTRIFTRHVPVDPCSAFIHPLLAMWTSWAIIALPVAVS